MIIALAGRRIDDPRQEIPRFPLSQRSVVGYRLRKFFGKKSTALVCSGACGSDLLALEVAGNLGMRRIMIIAGDVDSFKKRSVTDRPGNWEKVFDKVYGELMQSGDVIVLPGSDEEINLAILEKAKELGAANEIVGLLVWDGPKTDGADLTAHFGEEARKAGCGVEEISTNVTPGEKALLVLNQGARGQSVEAVMDLYNELEIVKQFNYARRIFGLVRKGDNISSEQKLELDQKYALSTYKDVDLPVDMRLEEALRVLKQICSVGKVEQDQETAGLTGAVYKRKWEADGQRINLEYSLEYYMKGYKMGPETDKGYYTGINAAYVLDLLAQSELPGNDYRAQAKKLRQDLVAILEKRVDAGAGDYWLYCTIAEACFGLSDYDKARVWLQMAVASGNIPDWQLESTSRQMAQIALLQPQNTLDNIRNSEAWPVLSILTGNGQEDVGALKAAFLGKVGLALSGGGFRAALYHIGVLARLAELDMLRNIEVLSCVSGGSIIGAHYYLELKHLLEKAVDDDIKKQDYIDIVKKISKDFLAGVQENLRMRVISNLWDNLRMFWDKRYSRSLRLGKLYERKIFARATGYKDQKKIMLNHLFIHPMEAGGSKDAGGFQNTWFNPKYDNWRRKAKVPILLLNSTTLNTGHNWQFSASWMGESPFTVQKIDGNDRLRRMYYKETGEKPFRREMRLGYAVAASSAVPGLFDPFKLDKLYPGYKVSLVDGGVHDNQGIEGLLEQDCTVMLVSDASGQMVSATAISDSPLAPPLRSNDILMERVRNAEYQLLDTRSRMRLLKGFMFIHLKMELDIQTVNWVHCEDPQETETLDNPQITITTYNIRKDLQRKLSNIRTDLDSFNDTEAHALMTSGYQMTVVEYDQTIKGFTTGPVHEEDWKFLEIRQELADPDALRKTIRLLDVASEMLFKVWNLNKWLIAVKWVFRVAGVLAVIWLFYKYWGFCYDIKVSSLGWALGTFVAGMFLNKYLIDIIKLRDTVMRMLFIIGICSVLWVAAIVHLAFFDPVYLKMGKRKI